MRSLPARAHGTRLPTCASVTHYGFCRIASLQTMPMSRRLPSCEIAVTICKACVFFVSIDRMRPSRPHTGEPCMAEKFIGKASEFKDGDRRIVFLGEAEIGVFR